MKPRLQIIRGLPGSGKSTIAKRYHCLHLEVDQFCITGGVYNFDYSRTACLLEAVLYAMKINVDLVLCGIFTDPSDAFFSKLLHLADFFGYEVYIHTCECFYTNQHGIDKDLILRMGAAFRSHQHVLDMCSELFFEVRGGLMPMEITVGEIHDSGDVFI